VPGFGRALEFLATSQLPYGEFQVYACASLDLANGRRFESSPFGTSLVVQCLRSVYGSRATPMIARAIQFVSSEMVGPGLFRYYGSRNGRAIPIDLDDTACASLALEHVHPLIVWRANVPLIVANQNPAGLFYTWLNVPAAANGVDAVVNANIVRYLGECEQTALACRFLVNVIRQDREEESYRYYPDNLALYYALASAYATGVTALMPARDAILAKIRDQQHSDGTFGDELATARAMCAILNLGGCELDALDAAARSLWKRQRSNGSWAARPAYLGPAPYYGSEEITTAFCLEALGRYLRS
jgi:hypothetical protein